MTTEADTLLTNDALADATADEAANVEDGKAGASDTAGKADEDGKADDAPKSDEDGKAGDDADEGTENDDADPSKDDADKDKDKDDEDEDKGGEDALTGAPESYEDFVVPDGVEFDDEKLAEFREFAKAMDLSQKGAQALIDKHLENLNDLAEAQNEAWAETRKEWRNATKSDKEIGGTKLKVNLGHAKSALNAFGNAEFVYLMDAYGLGDHPEVVRFLSKVGRAVSEDVLEPGAGGGGAAGSSQETQAARLFPTHKK